MVSMRLHRLTTLLVANHRQLASQANFNLYKIGLNSIRASSSCCNHNSKSFQHQPKSQKFIQNARTFSASLLQPEVAALYTHEEARFRSIEEDRVLAQPIPSTQRAAVFYEFGGQYRLEEIPIPEIGPDDVLVKVIYSGVCHTDLHVWLGDFPLEAKEMPIVGGHEGAGIVVKVGSNVTNFKVGDRAGIKWVNGSCLTCEQCKQGNEPNCNDVVLSGFHRDGSFQQYAAVKATEAAKIHDGIDLVNVSPILCAGVTVYKAIKESNVKAGQTLAITGAGGGLGSLCIQYAKAMGLQVLAIDVGEKEDHCRHFGADMFIDPFDTPNLVSDIQMMTEGGPHGVINIATAVKPMEDSTHYVRTRGTVVLVALPREAKVPVDVFWTVVRAITVKGSYVGSRQDTDEALKFLQRGLVNIPVQVLPLEELSNVFEKMHSNKITGRVVLDLWK
ncbi:unnamed protein product [Bursaphelenchus okinawaensis]|uniref:alcohol dehydrogenase n=1 Tax=Bursaphelenchus okinawaensis TaxID=465554 RepID=A0A811L929_9BILA|nr:unnamed protein product [Bursaphelenchus okinawaensis]CAG9119487.1 unnamed protein product [Bursaphelenchus okinawaensis]